MEDHVRIDVPSSRMAELARIELSIMVSSNVEHQCLQQPLACICIVNRGSWRNILVKETLRVAEVGYVML